MVSCESTGRELSFEWSHHRILSIDSKVRVTLQNPLKGLNYLCGYIKPQGLMFLNRDSNGSGLGLMIFHKMIPRTYHNYL